MQLRVRVHPARLVNVVRGQHPVASPPHDQGGPRVPGRGRREFPPPLRPHAAPGRQFDGGLQHHRAAVRLPADGQGVIDALSGGQRAVRVDGALQQGGAGPGGLAGAQRSDHRHREHPQQQRHLAAEPRAVDQRQAGDPVGILGQQLLADGPAERVAHHVHRPGFAEGVQGVGDTVGEDRQADRFAWAFGESEPRHVEGDHSVACGQPLVLRSPVLQAAADAVDQQHRRVVRVAVDPDPGAPAVDLDEGCPAHALARSDSAATGLAVPNRRAASSTGPLRSRAWSALKFISTVHGPLVPCCGNSSIARMM